MTDLTPFESDAIRTVSKLKEELASSERRGDRRVAWVAVVLAVGWFGGIFEIWERWGWRCASDIRPSGSTQYLQCTSDS